MIGFVCQKWSRWLFSIATIAASASGAQARLADYRYYPNDNRYSISMEKEEDRYFRVDKEIALSDGDLTDFRFSPAATIRGTFAFRSIEWLHLSEPLSRWQLDDYGRAMMNDFATARFGADHPFTIQTEQFLPNQKPPAFKFVATGRIGTVPSELWGVVLDFDDDVAMICEFGGPMDPQHPTTAEKMDADFVVWAMTIRKEPAKP